MVPSSSDLNYFLEVANTLNVSRAAERLGISQPTLSTAIQRLETGMQIPLLIRLKTGVRLTHAGGKLALQARSLLQEWEKFKSDVAKSEDKISGKYVLGCHPSVALYSLPSFFPELLEAHPSLEFKLVHDLSRKITEEVISFNIDFGIVVNPWKHPDLIIKPLAKDEVLLWTAKEPSSVQDPFSSSAVMICDPDLVQSQSILKGIQKTTMCFQRTITSSNLEVIAALVASHAGVGILPTRVAKRLNSLDLVPVKGSPTFHDTIALVYRADAQKSKSSRAIAKWIETNLDPNKGW